MCTKSKSQGCPGVMWIGRLNQLTTERFAWLTALAAPSVEAYAATSFVGAIQHENGCHRPHDSMAHLLYAYRSDVIKEKHQVRQFSPNLYEY